MRPPWIVAPEAVAGLQVFALVGLLGARVVRDAPEGAWAALLGLAAAAGYAIADVVSGLTHWFCDTFFREDTPCIGPVLIHPFREHHRNPAAMTRHGFLELTGNSCLGVAPLLGLAVWRPAAPPVDAAVRALALALFATNLFHKWAHSESVPAWVAALQRWNLILNPARHHVHHTPPNKGAWCVTNGWMNVLMDRILP